MQNSQPNCESTVQCILFIQDGGRGEQSSSVVGVPRSMDWSAPLNGSRSETLSLRQSVSASWVFSFKWIFTLVICVHSTAELSHCPFGDRNGIPAAKTCQLFHKGSLWNKWTTKTEGGPGDPTCPGSPENGRRKKEKVGEVYYRVKTWRHPQNREYITYRNGAMRRTKPEGQGGHAQKIWWRSVTWLRIYPYRRTHGQIDAHRHTDVLITFFRYKVSK